MSRRDLTGTSAIFGLILASWPACALIRPGLLQSQDYWTWSSWSALYGLCVVIFGLKVLEQWLLDPNEPPLVGHAVPYVGHLITMLLKGSVYFKELGRSTEGPIFTLPMPGAKLYMVTDPSLATSVQRATKTLSFSPLVPTIIERVAGFDKATIQLMKSDMETGYIQQVQNVVHSRLLHGAYLDKISLDACNDFRRRLDQFDRIELNSSFANVEFLGWMKHLVTTATATFFYGMNNPVESDPRLVRHFWDFDAGIPALLLGLFPSVTARKAYYGREAVVRALADYLRSPAYAETADITKERSEIGRQMGVDVENVARSDLTFFFAGIINTSLTSFWMVLNISSRPQLLADVRAELDAVIMVSDVGSSPPRLSIGDVVKKCPLLQAVYREVLRLYSDNAVTRVVLEDTMLADRFLLRKDSIVQVSGGVIHADERIWGSDVAMFRPERHLNRNPSAKSIHPAAFRAFGGGTTLCPGRHFAVNEILTLVALILLHFDVSGQDGGLLVVPEKNDRVLPIHVLEPTLETPVRFTRREKWAGTMVALAS